MCLPNSVHTGYKAKTLTLPYIFHNRHVQTQSIIYLLISGLYSRFDFDMLGIVGYIVEVNSIFNIVEIVERKALYAKIDKYFSLVSWHRTVICKLSAIHYNILPRKPTR